MAHVNPLVRTFWQSALVLSLVSACAGPDTSSLPQRTAAPAASKLTPATQLAPEAPTLPPAVVQRTLIALADPSLASTAAQRKQLQYLVRCALPADVTLYAEHNGTRFLFPGGLGLAPHWVDEAMSPREERWVSACLLAHVNYFGRSVLVSMRATPPPVPALAVSDDESQHFTIFEGGFFGNLFTPEPVAYACAGARTPSQASDPILHQRICTQASGETIADSTPVTACRFLLTGHCEDPASLTVQGTTYTEVIFTYLRPSVPTVAPLPGPPAASRSPMEQRSDLLP